MFLVLVLGIFMGMVMCIGMLIILGVDFFGSWIVFG